MGHDDGQSPAHCYLQWSTARRSVVGEHDEVGMCESSGHNLVRDIVIDECNVLAVRTRRNKSRWLRTAFPGLPSYGQPWVRHFVNSESIKNIEQVLQSLVWPNCAKEKKVNNARPRSSSHNRNRLLVAIQVLNSGIILIERTVPCNGCSHVPEAVACLQHLKVSR